MLMLAKLKPNCAIRSPSDPCMNGDKGSKQNSIGQFRSRNGNYYIISSYLAKLLGSQFARSNQVVLNQYVADNPGTQS